jgi:hypothetical protein
MAISRSLRIPVNAQLVNCEPLLDNGYSIGTTPSPSPNFWNELNYSFSAALTKVFSKNELRTGVDIVRMELNHRQAEIGNGLRGGFSFSGNITGATGYTARSWNSFAAFLLGQAEAFLEVAPGANDCRLKVGLRARF